MDTNDDKPTTVPPAEPAHRGLPLEDTLRALAHMIEDLTTDLDAFLNHPAPSGEQSPWLSLEEEIQLLDMAEEQMRAAMTVLGHVLGCVDARWDAQPLRCAATGLEDGAIALTATTTAMRSLDILPEEMRDTLLSSLSATFGVLAMAQARHALEHVRAVLKDGLAASADLN
jgi:hypothetical protein